MKRAISLALLSVMLSSCGTGGGTENGGAPALTVSPKVGSTSAGGAGVTLTATLSGGANGAISWSLAAGAPGSLAPVTGATTTYTPPGSVATSTTVAVTATTGALSDSATISVAPAGGPAPSDVTVLLQADRAGAVEVDLATGGTITTTSAEGTEYMLAIPPQSGSRGSVVITLTPVDDIIGLPSAIRFQAGVQFQPEGLTLNPAATLTIASASPVDTSDLFAFGYAASGSDFHMLPHADWPAVGASAELSVGHFSGAGVAAGTSTALGLAPTTALAQAEQQVAALLARAKARGILPWYDAPSMAEFSAIMVGAFDAGVRRLLDAAEGKVAISLATRPWEAAGLEALEATEAAARGFVRWLTLLRQWDDEVFSPRHVPPADWPHARTAAAWSLFYSDIGLSGAIDTDIRYATDSLDAALWIGPQDKACRDLPALDYCLTYDYLEMALLWANLNFIAGTYNPASSIDELDINAYCGGIFATSVGDVLIAMKGSNPVAFVSSLRLTKGDSVQLEAIATDVAGAPFDTQPPIVWETADAAVATVSSTGLVTAGGQGFTALVAGDGHACRFSSAEVYVYPPPFRLSGTGTVTCSGIRPCACSIPDPPYCLDDSWTKTATYTVTVYMNEDRNMGFEMGAVWSGSGTCSGGSAEMYWTGEGSPSDPAGWTIPPWEFGTPGHSDFCYSAHLSTDGSTVPAGFCGSGSPSSMSGTISNDHVCNQSVPFE